ncbi:hypothetical protein EDC04DRAFT_2607885 [Pisolithus marmoratus]|nr:hypothetical protein EDC04DRAFT_2607885 [Pisolithus marmoratus]
MDSSHNNIIDPLQMAKGNTRKGVTMIGPSPGHQVKQLEVRTWKANGQHRSQLVEVATKEPAMTTPAHSFPSSSLSKHSMSLSKHYFQSDDGVDNTFDMNDPPVEPMRLLQKKSQNDYIHEWLPQKEGFLHILLELEAPPLPHICKTAAGSCMKPTLSIGSSSELGTSLKIQPCTCGLQLHLGHGGAPCPSASTNEQETSCGPMGPGLLDNERHNVWDTAIDSLAMDEVEWEDIDNIPLHLCPPLGSKYLTIVNVTGVHFMLVQACQCVNAESYHMQLFHSKLCPSTFTRPSTVFTFAVLDDFLRDNVECQDPFHKVQRWNGTHYEATSLMQLGFLWHPIILIAEPEHVAQQWWVLKLLKWSGFHDKTHWSTEGDLVLFCMACPQPGINVSPAADLDQLTFQSWKYTRTLVMDGNFKAEHMHKSTCNNHKAISQASMSWGKLNSTGVGAMACAWHDCFYPHSVVDFQKGESQFLQIPPALTIVAGISTWHIHGHRKECYARYSLLFIKGSGWVDGEIIETLWSTLNIVSASTCGMMAPHQQELLDFQMNDSNFMKMIQMSRLDVAVTPAQQMIWKKQEEAALNERIHDPSVMDTFEMQLKRVHAVELDLLEKSKQLGIDHGAASWITRGLQIEEAEIILTIQTQEHQGRRNNILSPQAQNSVYLVCGGTSIIVSKYVQVLEVLARAYVSHNASKHEVKDKEKERKQAMERILSLQRHKDRLTVEWTRFITDGRIYLRMAHPLEQELTFDGMDAVVAMDTLGEEETFSNGRESNGSVDDILDVETPIGQTPSFLPLPSKFGMDECQSMGVHQLVDMELKLHMGQANDALHGLHLALADKAVIFKSVVRPAMNYSMRTWAWQMIHSIDHSVKQYAAIYRQCQDSMIWLGASQDILDCYQELINSDLATSTMAFTQGAHYHCTSQLPWFWTIDIPRDTNSKSWLTEFYHIHWLCTKAGKDHWEEEEELLMSEFQWVTHYFKYCTCCWNERYKEMQVARVHGAACYAARQQAVYDQLAKQAELKWQEMNLKN